MLLLFYDDVGLLQKRESGISIIIITIVILRHYHFFVVTRIIFTAAMGQCGGRECSGGWAPLIKSSDDAFIKTFAAPSERFGGAGDFVDDENDESSDYSDADLGGDCDGLVKAAASFDDVFVKSFGGMQKESNESSVETAPAPAPASASLTTPIRETPPSCSPRSAKRGPLAEMVADELVSRGDKDALLLMERFAEASGAWKVYSRVDKKKRWFKNKQQHRGHTFGTFDTHSRLLYLDPNPTDHKLQYISHHIIPNVHPNVVMCLMQDMKLRSSWDPAYANGAGVVMEEITKDVDVVYSCFTANNRLLRLLGFNHEFLDYRRVFANASISIPRDSSEALNETFWKAHGDDVPSSTVDFGFEKNAWRPAEFVVAFSPVDEERATAYANLPRTTTRVRASKTLPPTGAIIRSWPPHHSSEQEQRPRSRSEESSSSSKKVSTRITFISRTDIEFGVEARAVSPARIHGMTVSNLVKFRNALASQLVKLARSGAKVAEM